ncbi:LacI family DNA-binding transcriptional regulator [Actinoplanes sp. NPDC048988]|uniref:LacI family DNA-binding transcriptional regulator n=1 Tax=Actinoplanes sp. NPDC048988 TaxID=3363901 RepID=UPI003719C1E5
MADTVRRRITAADIAAAAGVSRATVGFVLNNTPGQTISEGTRQRVLAEAARLGYRPHRAAQTLARGRSRIVLFVLPDWPLEHNMRRYLDEAAHVLDEAGFSMVAYTRHLGDRSRPLWESLDPDVVVGFSAFDAGTVKSLRASGITKIFPQPGGRAHLPGLSAGTTLQVRHLHELGHVRLAFAESPDPRLAALNAHRLGTARRTVHDLGLGELSVHSVDYRDGTADQAVGRWHRAGVTAVVAYNDDVAAAVTGAALRSGLSVPGDLSVVGHDDSPLAALFVPALTSVRMNSSGLGRFVAQEALHLADGRPRPSSGADVDVTLVPRDSTAPLGA